RIRGRIRSTTCGSAPEVWVTWGAAKTLTYECHSERSEESHPREPVGRSYERFFASRGSVLNDGQRRSSARMLGSWVRFFASRGSVLNDGQREVFGSQARLVGE